MRFIRLRVANYRGLDSAEVVFSPTGITLVQGPNEAGKTSLGEAIRLIFDYPDSSKHRDVVAIKPVHKDEGPEIELQAETGPYEFTYFKRFAKRPETRLTISRPTPENLTDRTAHDRAEEILSETLDASLWKALIIQQGDAIEQPKLAGQSALSSALDRAAGGRPTDPREEGVFENVREEYLHYFTEERGAERKELAEVRKVMSNATEEVASLKKALSELDRDTDRAAELLLEIARLTKRQRDLEKEVADYTSSLEEIAKSEAALKEADLKLESARKSEQLARQDKETRQVLIDSVTQKTEEVKTLGESLEETRPVLKSAEDDLKNAQLTYDESAKERKEVDALASLRRADYDYYNDLLFHDQMKERKERIDEARKNAEAAEAKLHQNKVYEHTLLAIKDAERTLIEANSKLQVGAPGIRLRALANCGLSIDGDPTEMVKGDECSLSVADKVLLSLPGCMDIEVTAGTSSEGLVRKAEKARRDLDIHCAKAGVSTPDEAQKAYEERREAERVVAEKARVEDENVRDMTYEELARRLSILEETVPKYLKNRPAEPTVCTDLDSANAARIEAEQAQKKAVARMESSGAKVDAARSVRDSLNDEFRKVVAKVEQMNKDLNRAIESLDRARKFKSDDELNAVLVGATKAVSDEEGSVKVAKSELLSKNPERVKALSETANGSLKTTRSLLKATQTEQTEVQTRLKIHGEEGLHEKLNLAQARLEHFDTENTSLHRRAAVAKFLYQVMNEERNRTRQAYVAPIKEKIEQLGRLVFDGDFRVEISRELEIESRTTAGVTVPFSSLSGGTREQMSLMFRLACSMIVAKDGGTPLILDDALGYTDADRLHLMGAVLAKAAKDCQIVIFTCVPDRYSSIGEAKVVQMR